MTSQKLENLLNLALNSAEDEREKSLNLNVGYDPLEREWDLIIKYSVNLDRVRKIASEVTELQNEYALSLRYVEIQMDVLSTLTKYTQENLDEEIKELCKNYPQYRFMLYYKIMTTLQQIGNNDLLEKYYQEINTCIPMNEEQKDLLEVIKEIFG